MIGVVPAGTSVELRRGYLLREKTIPAA